MWTHFNATRGFSVSYLQYLQNKISFKGGSTANLHRHLRTRHPWVRLCEVRGEEEALSEAHPGSSHSQTTSGDSRGRGQAIGQTRLNQFLSRPMTPQRQETLDEQLGRKNVSSDILYSNSCERMQPMLTNRMDEHIQQSNKICFLYFRSSSSGMCVL